MRLSGRIAMRNKIIHTTLTAILAVGIGSVSTQAAADDTAKASSKTASHKMLKGMEKCFGVAKAGLNDCGTATNSGCAGSSKVDGDKSAWIYVPKGTCNKIMGGSTTEGKA
jgi:uncharacterized membrane protein